MSTIKVPATEFARNFGRYQDRAIGGDVVEVTSHGRIVGGYLSARSLKHYRLLRQREREILMVGELPNDAIADIENAVFDKAPR